jgi:FAD binding domain
MAQNLNPRLRIYMNMSAQLISGCSNCGISSKGSRHRQVPIGVVIPRDADDVIATVAACRERDVPVLGRGCGTSLAGQCCNVAIVFVVQKREHAVRQSMAKAGAIVGALMAAGAATLWLARAGLHARKEAVT